MKILKSKRKFYTLDNIKEAGAHYNIIFGERSNGKSYAILKEALELHKRTGQQLAYIRRYENDITGANGACVWDNLINNGEISKLYGDEYNTIIYNARKWWLAYKDEKGEITKKEPEPLGYAFALNVADRYKSLSFPGVGIIFFEEFLARSGYLGGGDGELPLFASLISTIVRLRNDIPVYMAGNTVNKYCPYFAEFGLYRVKNMKPGTIDLYEYGDSGLRVAVEYTSHAAIGDKPSDVYFAFDNPRLKMITGGEWELDLYPHCPRKFKPKEIVFSAFLDFDGVLLQWDVVSGGSDIFMYVHTKTTPIKDPDRDLIFSAKYDPRPNWRRNIKKPVLGVEKRLLELFRADKVFYQNNEIGDLVRNYLEWCNGQ